MSSLASEQGPFVPIPGVGEVYSRVAFKSYNFITENWCLRRSWLKAYLKKLEFNIPSGTSSLTPSEVVRVWHTLNTKRNDPEYIGTVSKSIGSTKAYAKKLVEKLYKQIEESWIRTNAILVLQDKKGLVYGDEFDPNNPTIIEGVTIQTKNMTCAKKLDEIIIKRIENRENPTLEDLVQTNAKFVGGKGDYLPKILMKSYPDGFKEDVDIPSLGIKKSIFPSGIQIRYNTDPDLDYRAVEWRFYPPTHGFPNSPYLIFYNAIDYCDGCSGSLQGRRRAD